MGKKDNLDKQVTEFKPDTQPMVAEAEDAFNMPSDKARKRALALKDKMKESYVEMCRLLHYILKKGMYKSWGFNTFDEYVSSELTFEKSKARHYTQLWHCLYESQGDKAVFNKVMALGWTKAVILQHVVNPENVDGWVEKGTHMSCEVLRKEVNKYKDDKVPDDPTEALEGAGGVEGTNLELAMKSMTLKLHHDDYLAVCHAVESMQKIEPGISISQAVSLISRDFMASLPQGEEMEHDPKATLVAMVRRHENFSKLRFVIIDPEEKAVLHGLENLSLIAGGQNEEEEQFVKDESSEDDPVDTIEGEEVFT